MIWPCISSSNFNLQRRRQGFIGLVALWSLACACHVWGGDCFSAPPGLVSWWPGDGNANELVGTNSGILQGGATASAAGLVGSAFGFDGMNAYIQIPDSPALRPTNLTIEAWVLFDSLDSPASGNSPVGQQYLVFKESSYPYYFAGFALTKTRVGSGDVFAFEVDLDDSTTNGQPVVLTSTSLIVTGAWYHVAGVRGSNFLQLYVNGQLESQTKVRLPQSYGDYPLYLGTTAQPTWDHKLAGRLDEISLYNRALSSGEITNIYAARAAGKCKLRIVAQPENQTVVGGTSATVAVTAAGFGLLSYQWRCDGENLTNGPCFGGTTTSSLTINYALWSPCHESGYSVVVTSSAGSITSNPAKLTVSAPLPDSSVPFPDANLEAAVRAALSKPTGPIAVSNLWALTSLSACGAHISNLRGLEYAANLMNLYLPANVISDLAPLQCLNTLVQLGLSDNRIANLVALRHLNQLNGLILYNNSISDISLLAGLTNLATLHLGGNSVTNVAALGNLRYLTNLFLYHNLIADISTLGGLTNLSYLELRWNSLAHYSALAGLTNLTSLYLGGNSIRSLDFVDNLSQLTLLDLDNSDVSDFSRLAGLTNLSVLDLSYNPLTNASPLSMFTNLTSLYLSGNPIRNLSFVQTLTRLAVLTLYGNLLTNLAPLAALSNLSALNLGSNPVRDSAVLTGLTNLTCLSLSAASISNLASLQNLAQLTVLDLANNDVSDLSLLAGLCGLRFLNLCGNQIGNCAPLSGLTNVSRLELENNQITDGAVLAALTNLTYLGLSHNAVWDLGFLANLTQLVCLNLDQNPVADLSPLLALPKLGALGLGSMPIWNRTQVGMLTNLTSLRLSGNSINDLTFLTNLARLSYLDLATNMISQLSSLIDMTNLTDLSHVDLRWNTLNVSSDSAAMGTIADLATAGINVLYDPQDQPPSISVSGNSPPSLMLHQRWGVATGGASFVQFSLIDDTTPISQLHVGINSGNPELLSSSNIVVTITNRELRLAVTPAIGSTGTTGVTLTISDGAGLSTELTILVTVMPPDPVTIPDPNLANAIRLALSKPVGDITKVDLFALVSLYAESQSISNLTGLEWAVNLNSLSLSINGVTDLSPMASLTELTSLSLSNSSVIDLSPIYGLTNLKSLSLKGEAISDLTCLTNLAQVSSLTLYKTPVGDLSPLAGLTNIDSIYLRQNRLTNIVALTNLPLLSYVDVSLNLLDFNESSPATTIVQALVSQGIRVAYQPQRQAPAIVINTNWVIAANAASWLYFLVSDGAPSSDFFVSGAALNGNLVPSGNLFIANAANPFGADWFLKVTPASNEVGTTTVTLTATNDAGLGTYASITVTVTQPINVTNSLFTDTNLMLWEISTNAPWFGQTNVSYAGNAAAQAGSIPDNTNSWLGASVIGPGRLTFWWKVSSETNYDGLAFWMNQQEKARISGEVDWQQQSYYLPSGTNILAWNYSKDRAISSGADAGWVAQARFVTGSWLRMGGNPPDGERRLTVYGQPGKDYTVLCSTNLSYWSPVGNLTATNTETAFIDSAPVTPSCFYRLLEQVWLATPLFFPDTNLTSWATSTNAAWIGQVNVSSPGGSAARSASITDNGDSWLEAAVIGPGILAFEWKVSSEPVGDGLAFSINGIMQGRISGEIGWQQQRYYVPSGTNILKWEYYKDYAVSSGLDAGWVSQISFVPGSWLRVAGTTTNGQVQLDMHLEPGKFYEVLASPNLVSWSRLGVVAGTSSLASLTDTNVTAGARFYRLHELLPPPWLELAGGPTSGQCELRLYVEPGKLYEVLASPNLVNWFRLAVVAPTNSTMVFADSNATTGARFYRLHELPPPPWLELVGWPASGRCELVLYLEPGKLYEVLASTNSVNWFRLAMVRGINGGQPFVDTMADSRLRSYRLQELPANTIWIEQVSLTADGSMQLILHSRSGTWVEIQGSTDLTSWSALTTISNTLGTVSYTDVLATNSAARFYRAVLR
jgi:internalin A